MNEQKEKAKDAYKFARRKGIIGLPTGPEKKPQNLLFANQDAIVGLYASESFMKNSKYTLDELICFSFIICISMAGVVVISEKYFTEEKKPKAVVAPVDIEMQKAKESKKTVKKTLAKVLKQNNAKVSLM